MDAAFDALGDPVRRRILGILSTGELSVGAIVEQLHTQTVEISQPAVSQHLKVLRDAAMVIARPEGTRRLYALDRAGLDAARSWLDQLADPLAPFAQPLDALATEVARGRRARRRAAGAGAQLTPPALREAAPGSPGRRTPPATTSRR